MAWFDRYEDTERRTRFVQSHHGCHEDTRCEYCQERHLRHVARMRSERAALAGTTTEEITP